MAHHCCPSSHQSHLFNVFKGVLSTLLSPPHLAHLIRTWLGLCPTHRLSPLHPVHLAMSPAPHILLTSLGPSWVLPAQHTSCFPVRSPLACASCPPPNVSSPVHPAHLVRSRWISPHAYSLSPVHLANLPVSSPACPAHLISIQSCLTSRPLTCACCSPHYISVGPHSCVSVDGVYGQMWEVCNRESDQ